MGCGSSSDAQVASSAPHNLESVQKELTSTPPGTPKTDIVIEAPVVTQAAKTTTFKQVHSAIRWGKPMTELVPLLSIEGAATLPDPQTGNLPIHIAAQNGHLEIIKHLAGVCKVDVNVFNKQGNTPLHMAIEYDYLDTALCLIEEFNASKMLSNRAGKLSGKGIEGNKTVELLALAKAETESELLDALSSCGANICDIEKSTFVTTALKKKKAVGPEWTDEVQVKFKTVLDKTN